MNIHIVNKVELKIQFHLNILLEIILRLHLNDVNKHDGKIRFVSIQIHEKCETIVNSSRKLNNFVKIKSILR